MQDLTPFLAFCWHNSCDYLVPVYTLFCPIFLNASICHGIFTWCDSWNLLQKLWQQYKKLVKVWIKNIGYELIMVETDDHTWGLSTLQGQLLYMFNISHNKTLKNKHFIHDFSRSKPNFLEILILQFSFELKNHYTILLL